ncbi:MAG: hypothetical protein K0M69_10850 [Youngiibacter sp.]|nr:hypothetical protein [Youngiibacter sp.]
MARKEIPESWLEMKDRREWIHRISLEAVRMAEIREACESFMDIRKADKYSSITFNTVKGIMKRFLGKYPGTELSPNALSYAIVETVRSYSSSKATAIAILKEFHGHAE